MSKTKIELAVELCISLYKELRELNIFPALTGGTLYKLGERKDIDIVLYTTEDLTGETKHKLEEIEDYLDRVGLYNFKDFGAVVKCDYKGVDIDLLFAKMPDDYDESKANVSTSSIPINSGAPFPCP